ncbi:MAG: hypothetical protein RLZZ612_27 [Pseudomonadota bacterium]|jgi:hypothetical protein
MRVNTRRLSVAHVSTPAQQPFGFASSWSKAEISLGLAAAVLLILAIGLPPVVLPDHYHAFVDTRSCWGIPNAMDVLSNGAFAVVGVWGLRRLWHLWQASHAHPSTIAQAPVLFGAALMLSLGLCFTAVGSGIFHWQPTTAGLALDRMAMSVIFAGLLGMAVAQHISERAGLVTMAVMVSLAPLAAAVAWFSGNASPWGVVQYGGMLLLLTLMFASQGPSRLVLVKVLVLYGIAKGCEMADDTLWALTHGLVSGHTLKHLVAAIAVMPMWEMLVYRATCRK